MYVEVPPVHEDVKVIVFPAFWVDGRIGLEVKVGMLNAGFTVKVEE